MPHLYSGLNQKRQGGKITNGTFVVGSTKSRGSSTRMVSHCKSNSENPSDCVNAVLNANAAKQNPQIIENVQNQVRNNDLFNRDTFSRYFNLYGEGEIWTPEFGGPYLTPEKYIIGLNNAADRWAKFLKVSNNAAYFIRTNSVLSIPDWNGIELTGLKIDTDAKETDSWVAKVYILNVVGNTGIIRGFTLMLNTAKIEAFGYDDTDIANILTHELGHALGIAGSPYKSSNVAQNREIQPLLVKTTDIESDPYVLRAFTEDKNKNSIIDEDESIFPTLIWEYDFYGGVIWKGGYRPPNISIKSTDKSIDKLALRDFPFVMPVSLKADGSTNDGHWRTDTLYTKNWNDTTIPDTSRGKISYAGIENDIMAPVYDPYMEYFISRLSIGRLIDLRNETDVGTIYSYTELNPGASEDTGNTKTAGKCIMFTGPSRSNKNQKNTKNIKNGNVIVCDCCPIIIDDVTSIKNIGK
jgi:hypothetical protein